MNGKSSLHLHSTQAARVQQAKLIYLTFLHVAEVSGRPPLQRIASCLWSSIWNATKVLMNACAISEWYARLQHALDPAGSVLLLNLLCTTARLGF